MITTSIDTGFFNSDTNSAILTVLLKPNKYATICNSYWPLSILNAEIKIYAKVLATRLETHMPKLHHDQSGFIKTHQVADNIQRLLHVINFSQDIPSSCAVLSLDAKQAFDHLEWEYLWYVLDRCPKFIKMIKTLYAYSSAMVITGNIFSSSFPISRGSGQGCVLSPLLLALSLEPLAQKIR